MSGQTFANVIEVHEYLRSQGWKISRSGLYKHRSQGKLKSGADGAFSRATVDKYASASLERPGGFKPAEQRAEEARTELLEAKTRKQKAEAELAEIKLKIESGKLVPAERVDELMVSAVAVLRASMLQFFYAEAAGIVHLVDGKPGKVDDLVDHLREKSYDWFHGFSKKREVEVDYGELKDEAA